MRLSLLDHFDNQTPHLYGIGQWGISMRTDMPVVAKTIRAAFPAPHSAFRSGSKRSNSRFTTL